MNFMGSSHDAHNFFTYYGWVTNPFSLKIDPDLFVGYENQTKQILKFIDNEERVALVLGPTGSGKTTMLKWLEKYVRSKDRVVMYLAKPPKNVNEFKWIFLERFPRSFFEKLFSKTPTIYNLHTYINKKLKGKHLILLVDEAHETVQDVLEWLRVFSDHLNRVSIVLAGLPNLEEFIKENLKTLYERITTKVELKALSKTETYLMIKKRIEKAGGSGIFPFTEEAIEKIYEITGGFPREILKTCTKVLEYAYSKKIKIIDVSVVEAILIPEEETREDLFKILDSLTAKQRKILEIIATKGPITTPEILENIDIRTYKSRSHALRAINNILKKLMELGLVNRKKKGTRYVYYPSPKIEIIYTEK